MKKIFTLIYCSLFCLMFSTAASEPLIEKTKPISTGDKIYTWIDKYGNRIYSDQPREGADIMEIPKGTDYTAPDTAEPDWSKMQPKVISTNNLYSHFEIASPSNEATIRNNNGSFQVALDIRPKLAAGHKIKLEIDGNAVPGSKQIVTLNNIDRGAHTLIAYILSAKNTIISTTPPVVVYMHRAIKK